MKRAVTALVALLLVTSLPATAQGAPPRGKVAPPAGSGTGNLHLLGSSPNPAGFALGDLNSDLAFWGDLAFQGTFNGFRIIDISAPANPREIIDFEECAPGTFLGGQGDVIVWEDILVRSWDFPAPTNLPCGDLTTPAGQEGLHIFDISDPENPDGIVFVPVPGGSHTATAVPDPENNRLLVYVSDAYQMEGISIVEIPLDDPESASVIGFEPAGRTCHDVGVILGDAMLAACAGHGGFTVWSLGGENGGSLDDPLFLYQRMVEGVVIGHSAAFSYDGSILVLGHEPGGGLEPRCGDADPEIDRTLFFFDTETGVELGRWILPETQSETENCSLHNYNVIPTAQRNILVMGNYQAGIWVVDFTDPANAFDVAHFDPDPLVPPDLGGDWSAYWYNGFIYESDIKAGLRVWRLSDRAVAGARKFEGLNPQTQMVTIERKRPVDRNLTGSFRLVGHNPLLNRGMNAALAIHGDYAYIGSRTDGDVLQPQNCLVVCAKNAGLMVVDISDPTNPTLVNQVGPPLEGNDRESSRELRVWAEEEILIVLHTNCGGNNQHNCEGMVGGPQGSINNFRFYDISGANAANPQFINQLNMSTHEFFLWVDPNDTSRALMFGGSAGNNFSVWDISPVADGQPAVQLFSGPHGYTRFPPFPAPAEIPAGGLHSYSVSNDGTRAYFALLTGGFAVSDVSDFALGVPNPRPRNITLNDQRPTWDGPGTHSAVKFWNRDWVYVSDEVYGTDTGNDHGCPWGWARMIDISDPLRPTVESEYRLPMNYEFLCDEFEPRPETSYSAHNPTLTPNIAFSSWHSGGMQAISLEDPLYPYKLADFYPDALPTVDMEDPRLSNDEDTGLHEKVVMWSYPIIKDGLIYVADLRNGLYVLEYDGRFNDEVDEITFLEGNSNQGHALCYEPVGARPAFCP